MSPSSVASPYSTASWRTYALWLLIALSVGSLVLSPLDETVDRVRRVAPWVGLGLVVSEALFVIGLAVMAWSVGIGLGPNPLRWRQRFSAVIDSLHRTPVFWIGLAVNTVGAVGSAAVVVAGVVAGLPRSTWGLLVLPVADLGLTAAVRTAVVSGVRNRRSDLDRDPTR